MPTATQFSRKALSLIFDHLGRARETLQSAIGDTNKNPAAIHAMEAAFARLRGTTLFHDADYAASYLNFGTSASEPVGLGLRGARFVTGTSPAYTFPDMPTTGSPIWTPEYWGPPCPEGWGAWQYGPWGGWAWGAPQLWETSNVPDNVNTALSIRAARQYPCRYDPPANSPFPTVLHYSRVSLFGSARYLSLYAEQPLTGATADLTLLSEDLAGVRVFDKDNSPLDLRVCYFPELVQGGGNPATWDSITLPAPSSRPIPAAFQIIYDPAAGLWHLRINVPAGLSVPQRSWWHVVVYWGSGDDYARDLSPASPYSSAAPVTYLDPARVIKWPRKNFFAKSLPDVLRVKSDRFDEYVNDPVPRLLARARTHLDLYDGRFSVPTDPGTYPIPTHIPAAPESSETDTTAGYASPTSPLGDVFARPFLIAARTSAGYADGTATQTVVVSGPELSPEFWTPGWGDCPYFPVCPEDHVEVARFVAVSAARSTLGVARSRRYAIAMSETFSGDFATTAYSFHETAVAWLRQTTPTHAAYPLGDKTLSALLLPRFLSCLKRLRLLAVGDPFADAAYVLAVPAVGTPASIATSRFELASGPAGRIFRGLLASPFLDRLKATDPNEPVGIPMSAAARGVVYDLAGKEQPVDLMRFAADSLSLTGEKMLSPGTLELYMEPSDQCGAYGPDAAGNRLGLDYTLRLSLSDGDENVLHKDWYVMASRYFLGTEEYQRRVRASLPLTGYYTTALLQNIPEFRLQGYAALVPDLAMGKSSPLLTRLVAPPDATKVTLAQFRQNLTNQGEKPSAIDEAVLLYLEGGGEFYAVDTSQYPNLFTGLRAASLSAATYTFDSVPYWRLAPPPSAPTTALALTALRCDSFAVAGGPMLPPGFLEPGYAANSAFVAGYYPASGDLSVPDNIPITGQPVGSANKEQRPAVAVKIAAGLAGFGVARMTYSAKLTAAAVNKASTLTVTLRSDDGGKPGQILVSARPVSYGEIGTTYADYSADLPYALKPGTDYWVVWEKSAAVSGATLVLGAAAGASQYLSAVPPGFMGGGWVAAAGGIYCGFYAPAPDIRGVFNREDWQISQTLPGPNRQRENRPIYQVEGWSSFSPAPFAAPQELYLYPRAAPGTDGLWHWVAPSRDIWVSARVVVSGRVVDASRPTLLARDVAAGPVRLWAGPVEALAYLGAAKTEAGISTSTHGAPAGDRLTLRSAI